MTCTPPSPSGKIAASVISREAAPGGVSALQGQEAGPDMESFHELCLGCHKQTRKAGRDTGPLTGECRKCHTRRPGLRSDQQPLFFGRFLHARHGEKHLGDVPGEESQAHCGACHHEYDEQSDRLVYRQGGEGSCRYCHAAQPTEETPSLREAAHESCVSCHQRIREQEPGRARGPVRCAGCHGRDRAWEAAQSAVPPDFPGERPDVLVLGNWGEAVSSLSKSPETGTRRIPAVSFQHRQHERETRTCRACHHESLEPCRRCHAGQSVPFQDKPVPLEQAMHDPGSGRSCIGCHNRMKQEADCAGCHHQIALSPFSKSRCEVCHTAANREFPRDESRGRVDSRAIGAAEATVDSGSLDFSEIPHHVRIDSLSEQYEAVHFPHGKILRSLQERIARSSLAGSFHQGTDTLCRGCHHTNFDRRQIQNCGSCHEASARPDGDAPDLKTAYHDQCMGCHRKMGLEGLEATQCARCHREKGQSEVGKQ